MTVAGLAGGDPQDLWRDELPRLSGAGDEAALNARIGYGLVLAPEGLLTPFAEAGLVGGDANRLRFGTRFDASRPDLGVALSGERLGGGAAGPEHAVRLDLRLGF